MSQKLEIPKFKQSKPYSILVTGATGFIGSKLVSRLTDSGYTVKAMSRRDVSQLDCFPCRLVSAATAFGRHG